MKKYFIACFLGISLLLGCDQADKMSSSMSPAKSSSSQAQGGSSGTGSQSGNQQSAGGGQTKNNSITYQSVNYHNNGLTEFILASQNAQGEYDFYYWTSKNATKIKMETLPKKQEQVNVRGNRGRIRLPGRDEVYTFEVQWEGLELIHSDQKRQMYSPI